MESMISILLFISDMWVPHIQHKSTSIYHYPRDFFVPSPLSFLIFDDEIYSLTLLERQIYFVLGSEIPSLPLRYAYPV